MGISLPFVLFFSPFLFDWVIPISRERPVHAYFLIRCMPCVLCMHSLCTFIDRKAVGRRMNLYRSAPLQSCAQSCIGVACFRAVMHAFTHHTYSYLSMTSAFPISTHLLERVEQCELQHEKVQPFSLLVAPFQQNVTSTKECYDLHHRRRRTHSLL